jgi:hypothetical protein
MKNLNKKENEQKFDDGVLRADGCMMRHEQSRQTEYRTYEEDLPEFSFGKSAYWEERRLLNNVHTLKAMGFKLKAAQSLEEFVQEHKEALEEGAI